MKILVITLLLLLCAADAHSQQENVSDAPPDLSVLKVSVRKSHGKETYYYEEGGRRYQGSRPSSTRYQVVFKVKNTGAKTIKVIEWHYMSAEQQTGVQEWWPYESKKMVRPGEETKITGRIMLDTAQSKDTPNRRVVIMRIEYTDGSVWERPQRIGTGYTRLNNSFN